MEDRAGCNRIPVALLYHYRNRPKICQAISFMRSIYSDERFTLKLIARFFRLIS